MHWEQDVPNQILAMEGACFGYAILTTKSQLERVAPGILARQVTAGKDRPNLNLSPTFFFRKRKI